MSTHRRHPLAMRRGACARVYNTSQDVLVFARHMPPGDVALEGIHRLSKPVMLTLTLGAQGTAILAP